MIAATVSGVGFRPASARVGSTPGVAKKIRNVSTVIANSTAISPIERLTMKTATAYPRILSFARGSSASLTPSPSTFNERTVSTIMIPGAIATHGLV